MSERGPAGARQGVPAESMSAAPDRSPASPHGSAQPEGSSISAWQRWEMNAITNPSARNIRQPAAPALPVAPVKVIDEAELDRLRQQATQIGHDEGLREGYAKGQAEGYAAGMAMAEEQTQALRALLLSLPPALRAAEHEVADDLLALALAIARQMVGQALVAEPEHILTLVRDLLRVEPTLNGTPRLLMHVDDAALVQQQLADELHAAGWRIRTDPSIQRGGCRVHAAGGALDATVETRWERVAAAFRREPLSPIDSHHE